MHSFTQPTELFGSVQQDFNALFLKAFFSSKTRVLFLFTFLTLLFSLVSGCRASHKRSIRDDTPQVMERDEEIRFVLPPEKAVQAQPENASNVNTHDTQLVRITLGATWKGVPEDPAPMLLLVPGAGRVSRRGMRAKNGSRAYDAPVAVTERLASYAAYHGFQTLAYDKRTCGPQESLLCTRNESPDWDKKGPIALTVDVDAACKKAKELAPDVPLIVLAHGQSANVLLAAKCAKMADVLVLIAPIPDAVDRVLVRGLTRRSQLLRRWGEKKIRSKKVAVQQEGEAQIKESLHLQNRAANFKDVFGQIRDGKFRGVPQKRAASPKIFGAQASFWQGYFQLTEDAQKYAKKNAKTPRVVVLGQWDSQYAPEDKDRIAALGLSAGHRFVVIQKGDHHLLQEKELSDSTFGLFLEEVLALLSAEPIS